MTTYTYRNGEKIELYQHSDEFIVRAEPNEIVDSSMETVEQLSSSSTLVKVDPNVSKESIQAATSNIGVTMPSYYETETDQAFLITDRIFLTLRHPLSDTDLSELAGRHDLVLLEAYSEQDFLFRITSGGMIDPVGSVVKLMEEEEVVESADHDLNYRMMTNNFVPSESTYLQQWHLHQRLKHSEFDTRSSANCEAAWQHLQSYGDANVVIGVTDDGCRLDHRDFNSANKFAGWGYFEASQLVTVDDIDANSQKMYQAGANHGTACAGVAAGEADAILTVGAAPNCSLLPIKWESQGRFLQISDSKLLTAINYMADKVDIISNSWGSSPRRSYARPVVQRIRQLAESGGRRGKGILFLWAAGNSNCPVQHTSTQAIPYTNGWANGRWIGVRTSTRFVNNLVDIPGVLFVAALASTAQRSHYSNYGTGIDLCAPSSNSHTYGRMRVRGLRVTTATGRTPSSMRHDFGGTSSATPLVAGIAGLLISANPNLTALEVASILRSTASKDLNLAGYPRTPASSVDPNPSWDVSPVAPFHSPEFQNTNHTDGTWSPWFGHGRVDAHAAVMKALGHQPVSLQFKSNPNKRIPDSNQSGVKDPIVVEHCSTLARIAVDVEIKHSWAGDLTISLIAPGGQSIILQQRIGGSADNVNKRFDVTNTPQLKQLINTDSCGTWQLHIQDLEVHDIGMLKTWGLQLQLQD